MVKSVLSWLARTLGNGVLSLLGMLFTVILFGGPFLVYAGGELSLRIGTYIGVAGILVAIVASVAGIMPFARPVVCAILYLCSFAVGIWLWVWSILYVASTLGYGRRVFC